MSRTCKLIRDQLHFDALSCLNPEETEIGFRVMTLVTYRGMTIPMKYLEEHDQVSLYYTPQKEGYCLYKKHSLTWCNDCPPTIYDISIQCTPLTQLLLMHSAFSFMMRMLHAAARAARASAWAAARAAAAAAGAAAGAARAAAWAAARADAGAAAGAAAADASAWAAAARADAARADAAAWAAAGAAAADARAGAAAADARAAFADARAAFADAAAWAARKAYKLMIIYRKEVKNDE